ncbi:YheC/YheD family protein [Ammoniphilus resinae]|uniref:YheC/YheD family protein n=1 Tax=Ammoniphilus resinae TaxID=861532 RepID=UPI001AE88B94
MNKGKWQKYLILRKDSRLKRALPKTRSYNDKKFWELLKEHRDVIVKPTNGSGGAGVIRVIASGRKKFSVHREVKKRKFHSKRKLIRYLRKKIGKNSYIVQQRIHLAKYNHRPFDIRIMVQRRKRKPWKVTGRLVKVAGPGYIITNTARSKGKVIPLKRAVKSSAVRKKLNKIALRATKCLSRHYRGLRVIGLDMAVDKKKKVWIIETNFAPATSLFLRLKDKSMYKRIIKYQKR